MILPNLVLSSSSLNSKTRSDGYQFVKCAEAPCHAIDSLRKMQFFVDYLEDILEDREDRLFKAFPEDSDGDEVSDKGEDSEDNTPLERFHYNRKQMSEIIEKWFVV
ncbi:hypothetical protein L596_012321 [Steinernema carpocapsae]|uniref:Uncharacterized protein n=1 Tax=Steinernema carpocapsae TaxID=34508 RepID=A0A4U5NX31_STECR|nr:hypothetical protein L596_012321 [Steinernema carpocapsae]